MNDEAAEIVLTGAESWAGGMQRTESLVEQSSIASKWPLYYRPLWRALLLS